MVISIASRITPTHATRSDLGAVLMGIVATAAEVILPTYLDRYRPGGSYAQTQLV